MLTKVFDMMQLIIINTYTVVKKYYVGICQRPTQYCKAIILLKLWLKNSVRQVLEERNQRMYPIV